MKSFKQLFEANKMLESERLWHAIDDKKQRIFIKSFLKESEKTWLDAKDVDKLVVDTTIDVNKKEKSIYLNRMDAHRAGKGYGRETMEYFLKYFKKKGFKTAKGYVEFSAIESANMMRKLGFKKTGETDHGRYFERKL